MSTSKKELLQFCRYYKGEKDNPFETSPRRHIWAMEKEWYDDTSDLSADMGNTMRDALERFISSGLDDIDKFDSTPLTLKAMLFALLEHWNEGIVTRESFTKFYHNWLSNNI